MGDRRFALIGILCVLFVGCSMRKPVPALVPIPEINESEPAELRWKSHDEVIQFYVTPGRGADVGQMIAAVAFMQRTTGITGAVIGSGFAGPEYTSYPEFVETINRWRIWFHHNRHRLVLEEDEVRVLPVEAMHERHN